MTSRLLSGVAAVALIAGLVVDNFAGGGGASTGIEAAIGRGVDYAVNHDDQALAMHLANHPDTVHISNNIRRVRPREITRGRKIGLAWFSPDCTDHSKAKGGKPLKKKIRDLAWVVIRWAYLPPEEKPDAIMLENVEEFAEWGPLRRGKRIKERRGETFAIWVQKLRDAGYAVQWRELRACDFGAPTIRKRFFLIARSDGKPIVWPQPTHGHPDSLEVRSGLALPWRTAAECIDWTIPVPSIFERKRDLKPATLRRIAHGVMRFVVNNPRPFIVPTCHTKGAPRAHDGAGPMPVVTTAKGGELAIVSPHVTKFHTGSIGQDMREPLAAVTANSFIKRPGGAPPLGVVAAHLEKFSENSRGAAADEPLHTAMAGAARHGVVAATLINTRNGEREGQAPRCRDIEEPYFTPTAQGSQGGLVSAFLSQYRGSNKTGSGGDLREPAQAITAGGSKGGVHQAVVCAHIEQANTGMVGHPPTKPLSTIVQKGCTQRIVETTMVAEDALPPELMDKAVRTAAFLIKYYGAAEHGQPAGEPLHAVTSLARFAVVTVTIDAETYVLVDIGMRMLKPRELFNAQGFPPDYDIECAAENGGKPLTQAQQIEKCGNSVCPPVAEALVRANFAVAEAATEPVEVAA